MHVLSLPLRLSAGLETTAVANTSASTSSTEPAVFVKIGDFFRMLGHAIVDGLHTLEVRIIDGINHVFAKIGDVVYHALLDCYFAIHHAVQWVFQQLNIVWDKLVAWLGFVFNWKDIVRTHQVMKNVIQQQIRKSFDSMATAEEMVSTVFEGLEQKLNALTNVTDPGITVGSVVASKDANDGSSSPQFHWGLNHLHSNMANAIVSYLEEKESDLGGLQAALHDLEGVAVNEYDYLKTLVDQIRTQIVDKHSQLTPLKVIQLILGIVGDFLLKTAKNVIVNTLDIIKQLAEVVLNILDAPIKIPVLGPLYKQIADAELSILDLVVLVLAIPATIMYKIAAEVAPFADDAITHALINAPSFQSIVDIFMAQSNRVLAQPMFARKAAVRGQATSVRSIHAAEFHAASAPITVVTEAEVVAVTSNGTTTAEDSTPAHVDSYTATYHVVNAVSRFFAAASGFLAQLCAGVKWEFSPQPPPRQWLIADAAATVANMIPQMIGNFNHSTTWENMMANVITDLSILKTLAGQHSALRDDLIWKRRVEPVVQIVLQISALPPAIGNYADKAREGTLKDSDTVGLIDRAWARIVGIFTPVAIMMDKQNPAELLAATVLIDAAGLLVYVNGWIMIVEGRLLLGD